MVIIYVHKEELFMATIVLGCDRNGVNDAKFQNTVAKILEKAGHTVEKLEINHYLP